MRLGSTSDVKILEGHSLTEINSKVLFNFFHRKEDLTMGVGVLQYLVAISGMNVHVQEGLTYFVVKFTLSEWELRRSFYSPL